LEHVALDVDTIAALDTVEFPFLLGAIQFPTQQLRGLPRIFNTAYVENELDRRVLALSRRLIDCEAYRL
jgi:hypothetical protein